MGVLTLYTRKTPYCRRCRALLNAKGCRCQSRWSLLPDEEILYRMIWDFSWDPTGG